MNSRATATPQDMRICMLTATVQPNLPWQASIDAVGPHTHSNDDVRKVGNLYLPTSTTEIIEGNYTLLNYHHDDGSWDKALTWAQGFGLKTTFPREAFAIGEGHSLLHRTLGVKTMRIVSTAECVFDEHRQACYVWLEGLVRSTGINRVESFCRSDVWFLFRN